MLAFIGATLAWLLGEGLIVTVVAGSILATTMIQRQAAKKQASQSRKRQQALAEEQARAAGRQRAIQQAPLTARQMKLVMKQSEIANLLEKFKAEDRIYTLPTLSKANIVDRINEAIDKFLWSS